MQTHITGKRSLQTTTDDGYCFSTPNGTRHRGGSHAATLTALRPKSWYVIAQIDTYPVATVAIGRSTVVVSSLFVTSPTCQKRTHRLC